MNSQPNTQPAKKLALTKTTLQLLTPQQSRCLDVPTNPCTSGLCFVADAQSPVMQGAGQESK